MNQDARASSRPRTPKSGSVKAARERAEHGSPSERSRPVTPKSAGSASGAKGVAISRPTPMPQWPLAGSGDDGRGRSTKSPRYNNSPKTNNTPRNISPPLEHAQARGSPPNRPNRPSYVPSILDSSKVQDPTPAFQSRLPESEVYRQSPRAPPQQQRQKQPQQQQRARPSQAPAPAQQLRQQQQQPQPQPQQQQQQSPKYWEQGYMSPQGLRISGPAPSGASTSSRPSTTSSVGSIPDFPVPIPPTSRPVQPQSQLQAQVQPRRSLGLGPPPTSRRGASSYYSQSSYVAPIPEESVEMSKRNQHGSYASSHLIPQSWADGPPGYYMDSYQEEEEDEGADGRESRESRSTDPDESTGLVRKASMGKQFKPTLTTVRGSDSSPSKEQYAAVPAAVVGGTSVGAFAKGLGASPNPQEEDDEDDLERYLDQPPLTANGSTLASGHASGATTPSTLHDDPRVKQILGSLAKSGALDKVPPIPTISAVKKEEEEEVASSRKQPLRLDIDAVREAEQRGSLTSLPDLIRRATKVASNLDKGRTASRLGMLDMFGSQPDLLDKVKAANAAHQADMNPRNSSISGMLASFPPPALTPSGDRPASRWPSPFNNANPGLAPPQSPMKPEAEIETRRRRCCGMPAWVFVLVLLTLICVIAAAVVVPIFLIVLPRQNAAAAAANLSNCPQSNPCANGGTSVVSDNSCRCVCANGFTGSICSTPADVDCTSVNIGSFNGATLGSALPRLITAASSNFSIPLNTTALLSTLSASNLSCSDENALVTFNGASQRRRRDDAVMLFERASPSAAAGGPAITSNGILLAPSATPAPTAVTLAGSPAASPSAAAPTSSPSPSTPSGSPTQNDLDFARVALLLILQDAGLQVAADAQTALKPKLAPGSFVAQVVSVGDGIEIDLLRQRVSLNSTVVGG